MVLRVLRVILRAVLRDITSVLRVTTRYYEWYYKVLRGTASCTTSDYEVLREVSGTTSGFLEAFSQRSSFEKIIMKNFTKLIGNQL